MPPSRVNHWELGRHARTVAPARASDDKPERTIARWRKKRWLECSHFLPLGVSLSDSFLRKWLRVLSIQGVGHAKLDTFWRGFHQRLNLHGTVRFVWRFKELRACWTVRQFKNEPDVLYILANYVMWSFHSSWSRIYNNIKIKSSWRSRSPRRP